MEKPSSDNGGRSSEPMACPRCHSLNTKFCYFNNHNVNQPRHFCRDCQRYWTAGGSLRNVPVGAGKRKHKGPLVNTTKVENLPNVFSFSGAHLDQGLYSSSLDAPPPLLSLKQQVPQGYGFEKMPLGTTPAVSQSAVTVASKPLEMSAPASYPVIPAGGHVEMADSDKHDLRSSPVPEKMGFTEVIKKPSLTLGLAFSKEAVVKEAAKNLPLHINLPQDVTSLHQGTTQCLTQHVTDLDESTGCSSVAPNLGSSPTEAFAESKAPCMRVPPQPPADQAPPPPVLNPMAAWGASLCPPWLWPIMMNGHSFPSPASIPPVDPTFAAAMSAMAGMPTMHPAFMAAMGAMVPGGNLPQVDQNVMATLTAGFLQFPHLWNPYAWGLQWNAAWNMANTGMNVPNGIIGKRPASPIQDQGYPSKLPRKDQTDAGTNSNGEHVADASNTQNCSYPVGYLDSFNAKVGTFKPKETHTGQSEGLSDVPQSPHMNPAAQARSAAFHEGT